ncbi:energy transducer TonB [Lysobacter sp.]|uniref:energy transducer TonB n=1 Tax=Lysobacter sp. TaxID=72226 RepID=UPI002D4C5996|nr:energy transducer TonB [Lysobacter sp.]HZX75723.1 energy transducer TonB [Lysobacter sp.]
MQYGWKWGALAFALAIAGCSQAPQQVDAGAQAVQETPQLPRPVLDDLDADSLRTRAEQALREQRIHSPAGDCAVDYYLALRERSPEAAGVASALTELQPYVLIAAEQALSRNELQETNRLLALLARMDAGAPALPRLREGLRLAQALADREEGAREAAASLARTVPPTPATAPSPARTQSVQTPPAAPTPVPVVAAAEPPPAPAPKIEAPKVQAPPPAPRALPKLIADAAPRYPLSARNRRIEGRVQVAFTIQPDGTVADARAVSAQPQGVFEEAALAAASRWRFEATGQRLGTVRTVMFNLPPEKNG